MHPFLSFNATYTGIMVSYGFYHKHQGWAFSFLYIRSVASSILFYVIDLSVSQSARVDKSVKFSGLSLSTLNTVRLPIPNKDDVESHLVMACAAGKMLHKTGLRMLQIECTVMKTPILDVCDRTRMKP
jgi:hypothetical protein